MISFAQLTNLKAARKLVRQWDQQPVRSDREPLLPSGAESEDRRRYQSVALGAIDVLIETAEASFSQKGVPTHDALLATPEIIEYIGRYGSRCRDCADEDGVCPSSGLPCAGREKAITFVLDALDYGLKQGYISAPEISIDKAQGSRQGGGVIKESDHG